MSVDITGLLAQTYGEEVVRLKEKWNEDGRLPVLSEQLYGEGWARVYRMLPSHKRVEMHLVAQDMAEGRDPT